MVREDRLEMPAFILRMRAVLWVAMVPFNLTTLEGSRHLTLASGTNIIVNLLPFMYLQGVREAALPPTTAEGLVVGDLTTIDKVLVDIHLTVRLRDTMSNAGDTTSTVPLRRCRGLPRIHHNDTMDLILNTCEDSTNTLNSTRNNLTMDTSRTLVTTLLDLLQTIHPEQGNIHQTVLPINTIHETTMGILPPIPMLDLTTVHSADRCLRHSIAV
jgi:hypothetical protein